MKRYSTIDYAILKQFDISPSEAAYLDMVYYLSREQWCNKSLANIAVDMNMSKSAIGTMKLRMLAKELIVANKLGEIKTTDVYHNALAVDNRDSVRKSDDIKPTVRKSDVKPAIVRKSDDAPSENRTHRPKTGQNRPKTGTKSNNRLTIDNTTDVVLADAPAQRGKPEINQAFEYWQEKTGIGISSKVKANRNACNNLLKKYGPQRLAQLIDGVAKAQADRYAPNISDFCSLQAKLNDLLVWGRRQQQQASTVGEVI